MRLDPRRPLLHRIPVPPLLPLVLIVVVARGEDKDDDFDFPLTNSSKPLTADELGIPRCESNHDCVSNGLCRKDADGYGRCLCPGSCPSHIPMRCSTANRHRKPSPCLLMDTRYTSQFNLHEPVCHAYSCSCPPMFHSSTLPTKFAFEAKMLPIKCDKRELKVLAIAHPSTTVYRGADLTLLCCTNMDPTSIIDNHSMKFIQNTTIAREATSTPYDEKHSSRDRLYPPWCWVLRVSNVQLTDTGHYTCHARPSKGDVVLSELDIVVKERRIGAILQSVRHRDDEVRDERSNKERRKEAPRSIQEFLIVPNATHAEVSWTKLDDEPILTIDLRLVRRTDRKGQEVWSVRNASSPIHIQDLRPATPYTMFISVLDGLSEPFKFTQHFQTKDARPHAPKPEEVRVQNSLEGLVCDVEWRGPAVPNGRIIKYYVRVEGSLRVTPPSLLQKEGWAEDKEEQIETVPHHFPPAIEPKCANFDLDENPDNGINPVDFLADFYSCKYGALKPNRNYTVSLWAENTAARSHNVSFSKQCITDFAEPDKVDTPKTVNAVNATTFGLVFDKPPDETNGPISCYYMAVVPLLPNASVDGIPSSRDIVMDTMANAYANNLHATAAESKRYLAYIAESYGELPPETKIGDGELYGDLPNCSEPYLGRFRNEDGELRTGLKYTGFLIVRVDKIGRDDNDDSFVGRSTRSGRHLKPVGPAYGYSEYFKPVYLQVSEEGSISPILVIIMSILFFLLIAFSVGGFMAHRNGLMASWCPFKKEVLHRGGNGDRRSLIKPSFQAIPVESLTDEFIMRHRDTDYLFTQEFEALPNIKLPATASLRNASKNRYKDIVAFDETRFRLSKTDVNDNSDYINANWIRSYDGNKRFIASQAPLEGTTHDFWKMIWESDARIVVMLSNLIEKNRSQSVKYWPDDDILTFGDYTISTVSAEYLSDHAIRMLQVTRITADRLGSASSEYANVPSSRMSNSIIQISGREGEAARKVEDRKIMHYHFTAWNDYKAPECPTALLRFLVKLRSLPEFSSHPVLVHCSAGVGRTGTLIAIDSLIDQCEQEGKADVYGFVSSMRKQRNLMVQNTEQYVFVYRALTEHRLFGCTDKSIEEFKMHYRELVRSKEALEDEFEKLAVNLDPIPSTSHAQRNETRNRFPSAVPYDTKRVILAPVINYADVQYINASTVKGYFYPYILAQDPLPHTIYDFWRMVLDFNVTTIVMLTPEEDLPEEEKYWPEEMNPRIFGDAITVQLELKEELAGCTLREMTYTSKSDSKSHAVWQFALNGWKSGSARPTQTDDVLSLIGRILQRQSEQSDVTPIVLHCRNGSSEAGVLCAISLAIERLKAESRIDIFQTVRGIQSQRPHTFTRIEEYLFCYEAINDVVRCTKR